MPTKRRHRGKVKGKPSRRDVSSEDMDSQEQLETITDRLSRKRLVKSSTDTEVEQQEQKENIKRQHGGDGYDADFETSEFDTTSAGSDMDCQVPFSQSENPRTVLSPSHGRNRRNTNKTQGNLKKKALIRQSRQASLQDTNNSSLASQGPQQRTHHSKRHVKRKNCSTDSLGQQPIPDDPAAMLKSPEMMFVLPNGSDSSTPLTNIADSKSEADSCFGFEGLVSPPTELPFSPVLPESPTSQRPLMDTRTTSPVPSRRCDSPLASPTPSLDLVLRLSPSPERHSPPSPYSSSIQSSMASMESSQVSSFAGSKRSTSQMSSHNNHKRRLEVNLVGLIPKDDEQGPPKKAVKKKKTQKKKTHEEDEWTMKMSAEFDDIEMFELTVE